ncbi:MAG: glycosyltransferase family 2 protein [Actinobacteria bacterium]|nr:glycosyltransferase family 2 protein [Actinomycetota bacterium]MBM3709328.1 glycosyltransferase family 2 protein [Actinomycetota bacterium]
MSLSSFYKISIIVVSFNSADLLKDCLTSLFENPLKNSFEILVVDNASRDGSAEMVKKNFPKVRLIENNKNVGFAAANNLAIKSSQSEYILLINSDCQVYGTSLDSMVSFMSRYEKAGIAGPKIINSDGSIQFSCRRFPSIFDAGMHTLLTNIAPDNPFSRRYKLIDIKRDEPFEVDWVSGSCMLIRRKALTDTGYMDENYFMYVEDIDICYQMWKKGWKVFYYPYAEILHHVGGSIKGDVVSASVRMQKSVLYFFWKNYRKSWKIVLLPLILPVLGLRIFLTFIKNLLK